MTNYGIGVLSLMLAFLSNATWAQSAPADFRELTPNLNLAATNGMNAIVKTEMPLDNRAKVSRAIRMNDQEREQKLQQLARLNELKDYKLKLQSLGEKEIAAEEKMQMIELQKKCGSIAKLIDSAGILAAYSLNAVPVVALIPNTISSHIDPAKHFGVDHGETENWVLALSAVGHYCESALGGALSYCLGILDDSSGSPIIAQETAADGAFRSPRIIKAAIEEHRLEVCRDRTAKLALIAEVRATKKDASSKSEPKLIEKETVPSKRSH